MRLETAWPGALSIGLALAGWSAASTWLAAPTVLPSPAEVWHAAADMMVSGELARAVGTSLGRIAAGYAIGAALGIVTGLVLGGVRQVGDVFGPLFEFFKGLPPIALVPIAIMWVGIGEASKHLIIAYIVWVVVAVATAVGVREIPLVWLRAGRAFGLTVADQFTRIILPAVASYLLLGLRSAIGFAYVALVSAELVAADAGVGYLIMDARFSLQVPRMIVGLIVLGLLGAVSQFAFDAGVSRSRLLSRYWRR